MHTLLLGNSLLETDPVAAMQQAFLVWRLSLRLLSHNVLIVAVWLLAYSSPLMMMWLWPLMRSHEFFFLVS